MPKVRKDKKKPSAVPVKQGEDNSKIDWLGFALHGTGD